MIEKHEWRKHEKKIYLPKNKPELIEIPPFKFITIRGEGDPNSVEFSASIKALYSLAYGLKMHLKKTITKPAGYIDYTVYPLEGVWDINDKAKETFTGAINKDDLVYLLMIRQPDFIDNSLFKNILDQVQVKKPSSLLSSVKFETVLEGSCIQMLHLGPFEDEHISFAQMESFAEQQGVSRLSKLHREIYLSDARRVSSAKYKTVLRFQTQPKGASNR